MSYSSWFNSNYFQSITQTGRTILSSYMKKLNLNTLYGSYSHGKTPPYFIEPVLDHVCKDPLFEIAEKSTHPLVVQKLKELEVVVKLVYHEELQEKRNAVRHYMSQKGKEEIKDEILEKVKKDNERQEYIKNLWTQRNTFDYQQTCYTSKSYHK